VREMKQRTLWVEALQRAREGDVPACVVRGGDLAHGVPNDERRRDTPGGRPNARGVHSFKSC
jgi:hypothetical protein